nr:MAG TPA: hypothetical protein [Caudoviricetes sp.]
MSYSIPYSLAPAPQKISVFKGFVASGTILAYFKNCFHCCAVRFQTLQNRVYCQNIVFVIFH